MAFNSLLAALIALAAIGCIARMNGTTSHAVRAAIVLVVVGSIGQAAGYASGTWDHWLDTLLYGGFLALLLANQRRPQWIAIPGWGERTAIAAAGVTLAVVLFNVAAS